MVIQSPLTLVKLTFQPSTFTFLPIDGTDNVLIIAGGQLQEAELHLHPDHHPRHVNTSASKLGRGRPQHKAVEVPGMNKL